MRISDWSSDVCSSDLARPGAVVQEMWTGGVNLPWNLAAAAALGLWLMFTRLTLGAEGDMADADHLIGALALTVISLAAAEVARALRFLLIPLGAALFVTPFVYDADGDRKSTRLNSSH